MKEAALQTKQVGLDESDELLAAAVGPTLPARGVTAVISHKMGGRPTFPDDQEAMPRVVSSSMTQAAGRIMLSAAAT